MSSSGDLQPGTVSSPVWNVTDEWLRIGNTGPGSLTIAGGGTVTTNNAALGASLAAPGTVTVTGAGSSWTNSTRMEVLYGSALTVQDTAHVTAGELIVADGASTADVLSGGTLAAYSLLLSDAQFRVSGTGSTLNFETDGRIFGSSHSTELLIENGGAVSAGPGAIFKVGLAAAGSVAISGAGSKMEISTGILRVGEDGGDGLIRLTDGGHLAAALTEVGTAVGQGEIQVSGAGSKWSSGSAVIGYEGIGELTVENGGEADLSTELVLGHGDIPDYPDAGAARVTGAGSKVRAHAIVLGRVDGAGTLTLAEGGTATAGGGVLFMTDGNGWADGQSATLNIGEGGVAGTLEATEVRAGTGTATVRFNHSDAIVFGARMVNGLSVTKLGSGATSLVADNLYTGGTTVSAGRLLANNTVGSALGTGPVTVHSGATLGGAGFVGGLTTIMSDGHLAPGNSIGTLTFDGGLVLEAGAILDFELGATSDLLRITAGSFDVSDATFNFTALGGYAPGSYTLLDWTGAAAGAFTLADFNVGAVSLGSASDYTLWIDGTKLMLDAVAIPEPSAAALFGVGALGFALWRRRRRPKVRRICDRLLA